MKDSTDETDLSITIDKGRRDHSTVRDIEEKDGTEGWDEHLQSHILRADVEGEAATRAAIADPSRDDAWIQSDTFFVIDGRTDFGPQLKDGE